MRIIITKDYEEMSRRAADIVISQMLLQPESVLGLATGSTPEGLYRNLIHAYETGTVDFAPAKTFNLDEYYGIQRDSDQSYYYFMKDRLFNHINIHEENIHIPNGLAEDVAAECRGYEQSIQEAGGIHLQVLGIGNNGHIGFNEPGDVFIRSTHLTDLDPATIQANARFFESPDQVPTQALTMGIQTIMRSKRILLLAAGEKKADAVYSAIREDINPQVPASILQLHRDVIVILDESAASKL